MDPRAPARERSCLLPRVRALPQRPSGRRERPWRRDDAPIVTSRDPSRSPRQSLPDSRGTPVSMVGDCGLPYPESAFRRAAHRPACPVPGRLPFHVERQQKGASNQSLTREQGQRTRSPPGLPQSTGRSAFERSASSGRCRATFPTPRFRRTGPGCTTPGLDPRSPGARASRRGDSPLRAGLAERALKPPPAAIGCVPRGTPDGAGRLGPSCRPGACPR